MERVETGLEPATEKIRSEARTRATVEPAEQAGRKPVIAVIALNLAVIAAAATALFLTQRVFKEQSAQAATAESRFVTTEWALLQEIQDRTEQILLEKDREIASLRALQASLAGRPELAEEAARVRLSLARAYAERETILQARLSGSDEALAEAVRRIEQTESRQVGPDDDRDTTTVNESDLPVDEQLISSDDSATLAWFRQIVDQLRFGRSDSAQLRLTTDGLESQVLRQSDYDRLLGLVTLVERQNTFLDAIAALERELDARDAEIARQDRRNRIAVSELSDARQRIETLELSVESLQSRTLTEEEAISIRSEMEDTLALLATERERSTQLERALDDARTEQTELYESLGAVRAALQEAERTVAVRNQELQQANQQIGTARSALADAEQAFAQLQLENDEAVAAALASATEQTYEATELLLDYLSGAGLEDADANRERILEFWEESQRYQELLTRARRLAIAGIDTERDDLPRARLVGVVTTLNETSVLIESLTDVAAVEGTSLELRSSEGIQPGELIAKATVSAVAGDLIQAELTSRSGTLRERDLAYVVLMPERE
jgi:DNA repair exonuclease SbcCD ATPase subunit